MGIELNGANDIVRRNGNLPDELLATKAGPSLSAEEVAYLEALPHQSKLKQAYLASTAKTELQGYQVQQIQALVANAGNGAELVNSTGYHFAGIATDHINTVNRWYDFSGMGNDAVSQASITAAATWANPGYCTIPDPVGTTALMELPALNFDYAGGESLFIFWRGFATPEAADYPMMGDSGQGTGTYGKGISLFCKATGKMQLRLYNAAGTAFGGGDTSTTVFSPTVENTFAVCLDGVTRTYCYWANGMREPAFASNFLSFSGGPSIDTVSGRTFKLGGSDIVPAGNQWGVLQKIKQHHILRRAAGRGVPAGIDSLVLNLHRNVQRLVTAAEW